MSSRSKLASASQAVVRYYTALRISAAAATGFLSVEDRPASAPIVRQSNMVDADGFDRRELIERGGRTHVVVVPAAPETMTAARPFSMN